MFSNGDFDEDFLGYFSELLNEELATPLNVTQWLLILDNTKVKLSFFLQIY